MNYKDYKTGFRRRHSYLTYDLFFLAAVLLILLILILLIKH